MATTKLTAQNLDPNQTTGTSYIDFSGSILFYKSDGTTALTGAVVKVARFSQTGKTAHVELYVIGLSNPSGPNIFFTVPITPLRFSGVDHFLNAIRTFDGTNSNNGYVLVRDSVASPTTPFFVILDKTGTANWGPGTGTGNCFSGNFSFEVA